MKTGNPEVLPPPARRPDARATRSRNLLRLALRDLMVERPFKQLTIKEITSRAGVSYPVFFRQFRNIEDIFNDIAITEVDAMLEFSTIVPLPKRRTSTLMCRYLAANRIIWQSLFTAGASSTMRERFAQRGLEHAQIFGQSRPDVPLELSTAIVSGAIFEAFGWWLRQPDDCPIEIVRHALDTFVMQPSSHRLDLLIAQDPS